MPDFPDGWDIVRPVHGAVRNSSSSKTVTALDYTTLVTITGKGIIYGGVVYLTFSTTQQNSFVYAKIDDQTIPTFTFQGMINFGLNKPWVNSFYILCCNNFSFRYAVGISPGITFDSSFEIIYWESNNKTPIVFWDITYSIIS